MESKRERFIRIAENRTNRILDNLKLLGNCANRHNYDFTAADVQKIFTAIEKEMKHVKSKFNEQAVEDQRFTLS